jgi:hypothetical protein
MTITRRFFWSGRTLRYEVLDEDGFIDRTEDVLGVDRDRCIYAMWPFGEAIVEALNERFGVGEES